MVTLYGLRQNSKIDFLVHGHTNHYIWGVGVGTLMGCANPIILPDLCFTLEMATFEPKKSFPNILPKEVILMAYQKKFLFGANGPATQLWIHCKDCFTILPNKRGQERHGNYVNGFSERNLIQSNLVILEQKWYDVLLTLNLLPGFFYSNPGSSRGVL